MNPYEPSQHEPLPMEGSSWKRSRLVKGVLFVIFETLMVLHLYNALWYDNFLAGLGFLAMAGLCCFMYGSDW